MKNLQKLNFDFKLPGAQELYLRNKELFEMKNAKSTDSINLNQNLFIDSCENPISAFKPTFSGFLLGFIEPFRYKLYFETVCYLTLFFCIISLQHIIFRSQTNFFFNLYFLGLYLFFMSYSKAMWARKVYNILKEDEKLKVSDRAALRKKIKPNSFLFTITFGIVFVMTVVTLNMGLMAFAVK